MKKLFGFLIIVTFAFVACEGPAGPPGRDGRDGIDGYSTGWFAVDVEIKHDHWRRVEENGMYFFENEVPFPEVDEFIFMEGAVIGYFVHNVNNRLVHSLMPHTLYGFDGHEYSETYSLEIRPGFINFVVRYSDGFGFYDMPTPPTRLFRIVLIW